MKLQVNMETREVSTITDTEWESCPSNGQHVYKEGYVLAEVHFPHTYINLLHPNTDTISGHVDVAYHPEDLWKKKGIRQYAHNAPINWAGQEMKHCWPTGGLCLLQTIIAIEEYLAKTTGYHPQMHTWVVNALDCFKAAKEEAAA